MGMYSNQPPYGGEPPQQPYGTPPPQQPYGSPPQHPYGAPPPQQPYGAPPQQPYGAPPQQPYGYGQQQYGMPQPAGPQNRWGPTSLGMDANVAAGLSYIFIVGIIFFFAEKTNRFVRFHAAQAILLDIIAVVLWIVQLVIGGAFSASTAATNSAAGAAAGFGGSLLLFCVFSLLGLGLFGLWLWGLISGFTGRYTKIPIIGDWAESWAGGPPMGGYPPMSGY